MVIRIRKSAKGHLYVEEWLEHLGISDDALAGRLNIARTSVWRWKNEQHRLSPGKIQQLADALGIKPVQLWSLPTRPSLDALLDDATDEVRQQAAEMLKILVRRSS
jgi:transcriptional regulator with XRE-family HTH domain